MTEMKMSDVKFKSRFTEGSTTIDPTLTLIGFESIEAVEHAISNHDKLVELNKELSAALSTLMASEGGGEKSCGHVFDCICAWDRAKKALDKARSYYE